MVIVFDLDDTLYNEIDFVYSGFRAVSSFLSSSYSIKTQEVLEAITAILEEDGRGKIFDRVLTDYGIFSKALVSTCLSVYRLHQPQIELPKSTINCLERLGDAHSLYIVTDGNKIVQRNKVNALGVERYVKKVFITHCYGVRNAKPSPYCFNIIAGIEKADPSEVIYIGDNPQKDFVGIKPLGFKTIRIINGDHKSVRFARRYEADLEIQSLAELDDGLIDKIRDL